MLQRKNSKCDPNCVSVRGCGTADHPVKMRTDDFETRVGNPVAVLDGNYPEGTKCFYQIEYNGVTETSLYEVNAAITH